MKVAIIHDYINEYGGAERVLKELSNLFPDAPIYTAFKVAYSTADKEFRGKKIIESFLAPILKIGKLYSPLRFLAPVIWGSFDLSKYDLVVASASWYITKGFKVGEKTKVIVYCHTPPRWLYGYETSVGFTKYWPVKIYAKIVGHFMRKFDFKSAQKVDYFIANSQEVAQRISRFYHRDSTVINPPIDVQEIIKQTKNIQKENFYLIVSRLVGAKGILEAVNIFGNFGINLKIVGEAHGFSDVKEKLKNSKGNVEMLGFVSDEEKFILMAKAKAFVALAKNEDFGMTVVESQAAGTPVIAFNGGGFKETIVDGVTGVFINEINKDELNSAIKKIERTKWNKNKIIENSMRFSKERFKKEMLEFVNKHANK
ncbi:MAG TPA: glycosyltransferase [Patescibacteria group bacterium]|nr:glycosyltransferase [Patescibacteria group bacterium]